MSKTQKHSLKRIRKSGRGESLQAEIVAFISKNPGFSRREIAEQNGWLLNSVSARISEAINEGLIAEVGTKICESTGAEVARLYLNENPVPDKTYDIRSKSEIKKVFKLLSKIKKENQQQFEQTMRVLNTYFGKKNEK